MQLGKAWRDLNPGHLAFLEKDKALYLWGCYDFVVPKSLLGIPLLSTGTALSEASKAFSFQ